MSNNERQLVIISGPSGVGKGTVINELLRTFDVLSLAVSATTRSPREGEVDGREYHFLSDEVFDNYIKEDKFLEWCPVHLYRYGTLVSEVERINNKKRIVLLEIDTQGAKKIKKAIPETLLIFLSPPSIEELEKRLIQRNTETEEQCRHRLEVAKQELSCVEDYDFVVINDIIGNAIAEIEQIVKKRYKL